MHYRDWTAVQVREWIEEAAKTTSRLSGRVGPKKEPGNAMPEIVREAWKDAAPNNTPDRIIPSARALACMEAVWGWINALQREEERRLLYDWSAAKALGKGSLARVIEQSEYAERTFSRAVNRVCQRIADSLNRKQEVRLTMAVDDVSVMGDPTRVSQVASVSRAKRQPTAERYFDRLTHDDSAEAAVATGKMLAAINKRRQNQARRAAERRARQQEKRKAEA